MYILRYDGTFDGLISAVFDLYDARLFPCKVLPSDMPLQDLFAEEYTAVFEEEKYRRVSKSLISYLGKKGLNHLWRAYLSEMEGVEDVIIAVIQYTFQKKSNVLSDFGHPAVMELQQILKQISRERHRMTAFVRFKLGKDNIYYATIEPDFNVLPLISAHFKNRYADQKWVIWDSKRNYGLYYDLEKVIPVEFTSIDESQNLPSQHQIKWDETEEEFQQLWKKYFKATNIKSRKNIKLHLQHVPKRYWKYLIEKE